MSDLKAGDKCVVMKDIVTYGKELKDGSRILVQERSFVTFKGSLADISFVIAPDNRVYHIKTENLKPKVSEVELKDLKVLDYYAIDRVPYQYKGRNKEGLHKFENGSDFLSMDDADIWLWNIQTTTQPK